MMSETILNWLNQHQDYALLLIPAFAFLEAIPVVGLFISGAILLTISTVLYTQQIASLSEVLPLAFIFAALADHLGFFVGRWVGPKLHHTTFARRHQKQILRAEGIVLRFGPAAVILGRLITMVRSLVPVFIGISGMRLLKFTLLDLVACLLWTTGLGLLIVGLDGVFS